jgi:hypothetical protein
MGSAYLVEMLRFDPAVDKPTSLDQTETIRSQYPEGHGFMWRITFTLVEICLIET